MKLNLGCGKEKLNGYIGMDRVDFGQEIMRDIYSNTGRIYIPSPEQHQHVEWEEIRMSHFLEHFNNDEAIEILNECWKKSKSVYIIVPHMNHEKAHILQHKIFFTEETFKNLELKENYEFYNMLPWKIEKMVTNERPDIHVWMTPNKDV